MSEVAKRQRDTSNTPEPEAKRPNVEVDNQVKHDTTDDAPSSPDPTTQNMASDAPTKPEEKDAVDLGSGVTADAPPSSSDNKADNGSVSNGQEGDQAAGSAGSVGDSSETQATQISMRTLIVTSDASIIIGKSGKHINEIRDKSNARLNIVSLQISGSSTHRHSQRTSRADRKMLFLRSLPLHFLQSEIIPGNPERILTVSGPLDAVSKVSFELAFWSACCRITVRRTSTDHVDPRTFLLLHRLLLSCYRLSV